MKANKQTWIVIPVYNEGKRLVDLINKTKKYSSNIVVVDDGSSDNSYKLAKDSKVNALRHIVNLGKGAALKTGCDFALKQGAETLVVMDGDGQHEPEEIPNIINALKSAEVIIGSRKRTKHMPSVLKLGNWGIHKVTRFLYGFDIKDTQSGYRAFNKQTYKKIRWIACDYSMESEMIANAGKLHLKIKEIPIKTIYSDKYKGTTVLDGIKVVMNMIKWRLFK